MVPPVQTPTASTSRRMTTNQGYCHPRPPGVKSVLDAGKRCADKRNINASDHSAGSIVVLQVVAIDPFGVN